MNKDKIKEELEDLGEEVFQYDKNGKEVMTPMKCCGVNHSPEDYEGIKVYLNGVEITGFMNDEDFI